MSKRTLVFLALALVIGLPVIGLLGLAQPFTGRMTGYRWAQAGQEMGSTSVSSMDMMAKPAVGAPEIMPYSTEPGMPVTDVAKRVATTTFPVPPTADGFTQTADRLIIRQGFIYLLVNDPRETMTQITQLMSEHGGFVTQSHIVNESPADAGVNASMTLRIPVAQLEAVMSKVRGLGVRVTSESITAVDQTEQKVDLEAQLRNLQATETQLVKIMGQATTVSQTLEVQRELSSVRTQIEQLTAQRDNLTSNAAMATVTVNLSTEASALPIVGPQDLTLMEELKITVRNALVLYRQLFIGGLKLMIVALPLILIGLVVLLISRRKPKNQT